MAATKTLYHSELVKSSPATLTITSEIRKSKYAGKPNYVEVLYEGNSRYLTLENEDCETFFEGMQGRTMVINATGSRDNAAFEFIEELEGQSAPPPNTPPPRAAAPARRAAAPPPRAAAPPAQQAQPPAAHAPAEPPARAAIDPIVNAKQIVGRVVNLRLLAMKGALIFRDEIKEQTGLDQSPELTHATATSIMIALERASLLHQMPVHPLKLWAQPAPNPEPSDNDGYEGYAN